MSADGGGPKEGRILALDFGTKRIGAALSDPARIIATPLEVHERRGRDLDLEHYRRLVAEHEVTKVVVGLPARADGGEGPAAVRARAWGRLVQAAVGVGVVFFDERYSTVEAEALLREQGVKAARRRGLIDMMAAQVLLQAYLDAGSPEGPDRAAPLDDPEPGGPP